MSESKSRPLLMIPGPIEYHEDVLAALGEPSPSHVQADFIETFGRALELFRDVLQTKKGHGQPLILSGSGTLGWDIIASNLIEPQELALVVNTGYFSDSFADCLQTYGAVVEQVHAPAIGETVSLDALSQSLKGKKVKLVTLTQVDTSTGVLNNVRAMAELIRKESPGTLIAVDGVCSFGGEDFQFDAWGIDAAMTCSQKALGVPPGLCLLMLSQKALGAFNSRAAKVANYYANLKNWLPIMAAYEARQPSYFATPAVNLIKALHKSLDMIASAPGGIVGRIAQHVQVAEAFQTAIRSMGLVLVPARSEITAHTLSAIRLPQGVKGPDLLGKIRVGGVTLAGGLHKQIKAEYFRVGHMGISVTEPHRKHMLTTLQAIESALSELGVAVSVGKATQEFEKLLK